MYGKLCHLIWGIGEKVLKLWRQECWPFSPGWAAHIMRIHSWTFRLPWPYPINWENSLINYLWGRASGPAASAKLRRLFRRLEDWELLRDILLPIMGAPPETPPGPPGLGGLNPSESERFVLDPVDKEIFRVSIIELTWNRALLRNRSARHSFCLHARLRKKARRHAHPRGRLKQGLEVTLLYNRLFYCTVVGLSTTPCPFNYFCPLWVHPLKPHRVHRVLAG